jgi:ankyrin repeat protein
MWAGFNGQREAVEALLAGGADKALREKNGETAFDLAMKKRHVELARALLVRAPPRATACA